MKKKYIEPQTDIIMIDANCQLLAGSVYRNSSGDVESISNGGDYNDGEII